MPTLSESGLTGYDLTYWVGLFGPKGLPLDVQARLQAAVKTTLADPEVQRKLNGLGMTLVGSTPEQMVKEIRVETEKLRAIAAQIPGGIQQ
jgi:tripartite-type tricarboxylate transporter receptor subunit TctC